MSEETKPAIYAAMVQIMKAVEAVRKEKTNTQGASFKYRGIDDVMNALHDAFAEAGVFITVEVLDRKETERQSKSGGALFYVTQKIRFTFNAMDGSSVSSIVNGTAMDSGDKADNKGLSIGLKYALLQAFLVPTEDMAEPDAQTHEVKPKPKQQMTETIWLKSIARLDSGEADLPAKIRAAFTLTDEQSETLKHYEK